MRRVLVAAVVLALVPPAAARPARAQSDPLQPRQWGLANVEAPAAWPVATGAGAVVAVVDTGVDKDHPELAGRLTGGASWIDCGKRVKPPCTTSAAWDDRNGHGTHVAGIAAAPLDGQGVAGVAPDARVMPVRVLDAEGSGFSDDVADGIRWAVDHGADVVNLSLAGLPVVANLTGALGVDGGFAAAIEYAVDRGVLVVAAAGNEAFPLCENEFFVRGDALCVGATDRRGLRPWYSNWGIGVEIAAPGGAGLVFCSEDVLSTWPLDQESFCEDGGYEALAGTSMATPHVAGIGALLAELGVSGRAAADRIVVTADGLAPGEANARRAVGA